MNQIIPFETSKVKGLFVVAPENSIVLIEPKK